MKNRTRQRECTYTHPTSPHTNAIYFNFRCLVDRERVQSVAPTPSPPQKPSMESIWLCHGGRQHRIYCTLPPLQSTRLLVRGTILQNELNGSVKLSFIRFMDLCIADRASARMNYYYYDSIIARHATEILSLNWKNILAVRMHGISNSIDDARRRSGTFFTSHSVVRLMYLSAANNNIDMHNNRSSGEKRRRW